ncbi:MAG: hypothetical protein GX041_00470 [Clostridiales bacterium]|jgi:hypothetical protein|nr:hypothetical protein [Clostridiales bacterium]
MKYHIDTIPVWDAYHQESECPLCILYSSLEKSYIESFLGASVMESDTRIQVNRSGFCPHHFKLLYDAQNRLGLALMTHTHLKELMEKFENHCKSVLHAAEHSNASLMSNLFIGKKEFGKDLEKFQNWITEQHGQCLICEHISNSMNRYAYTILHLYYTDAEFKKTFASSKGFCMDHLALTIKIARETLSPKKQALWLEEVIPLQLNSFSRLENELSLFINKFDYRKRDEPLGSAKDSLQRTIQKLTGKYMD